jgi:hypothetical protein
MDTKARTHYVRNYAIILNGLPAMLNDYRGIAVGDSGHQQMIAESVLRYMGLSSDFAQTKVMLQVCLGVACVRRRRSKAGALLLGAAVPTALFAIIWSGHRVLQNEWFSPLLMW